MYSEFPKTIINDVIVEYYTSEEYEEVLKLSKKPPTIPEKIKTLEKEKAELETALLELAQKQSEENEYRTQLEVALVELAAKVGGE